MERWLKILYIGLVIVILFFVAIHIFVNIRGKSFLIKKLEQTFGHKVEIGSLTTSFPINLHLKNIEAKGLFTVDEVTAGGGILDVFRSDFKLSLLKIVRPVVTIERDFLASAIDTIALPDKNLPPQDGSREATGNKAASPSLNPLALARGKFLSPAFSLARLIVDDGTLNFIDRKTDKNGISIKVKQINIKVNNFNASPNISRITSFELKGKIPWREGQEEGKVELGGWLNLFKKDMEANLKITDIDGIYLYPYYSQWIDLEKARIEKAKLNFTSNIHGFNNNITAECHLELSDIVRKPLSPEESEEKAAKIADTVIDIFRALNQGKIVLDFTIRTKMNRPEFGFGNIKMAFEDKLAQGRKANGFKAEEVFALPAKLIENTFKGATDFTKSVIVGTINAGKEIARAVEDTLKKEEKQE